MPPTPNTWRLFHSLRSGWHKIADRDLPRKGFCDKMIAAKVDPFGALVLVCNGADTDGHF
jgi:hypothetical protein